MKGRVIMGIVLAKYPSHSAGHQLSLLHWLLGFRELGWDVWIVENLPSSACFDRDGQHCVPEASVAMESWRQFVSLYGFERRESLFIDGACDNRDELEAFAIDADLFLNYAGQFDVWEVVEKTACRAYLDVDPGYTQAWARGYGCDMHLESHNAHITIGCASGAPWCRIPETGHSWIATVPPVSLSFYEAWNARRPAENCHGPWTTITHWYGAAPIEMDGMKMLGKRDSFLPLKELPGITGRKFHLATEMGTDWEDYQPFSDAGWTFEPLDSACASMGSYLNFLRASAGELGVAKHGYVATRSGWLSDRTLAYLACGVPVAALDTGWTQVIGELPGLRSFADIGGAAKAIREIENNYPAATRSALEITATIFEARRVISQVLSKLGIPVPRHPASLEPAGEVPRLAIAG